MYDTYEELLKNQPQLPYQNFEPMIIKNVLSKEEKQHILDQMDKTPIENIRVQKWGGQGNFDDIKLSDLLINKINKIINKYFSPRIKVSNVSIVRYSPQYGYQTKLFPHYDTRETHKMILDIQLQQTEQWGIIVEGKKFYLDDNDGLFFSGTQQIHWREDKKLSPSAKIDMIFCWFDFEDIKIFTKEENDFMMQREAFLLNKTKISNLELKYE